MKKHFVEKGTVDVAFSACGIHRVRLEPSAETKSRNKVTCSNCKKALKARSH